MHILVTGGAGYIGSHTCLELIAAGHEIVVVDNLSNSSSRVLARIEEISGRPLAFEHMDLLDQAALEALFQKRRIDGVIHFAGFKAVGESVLHPLRYYHNNVTGSLNLLRVMEANAVRRIVFSSSAAVYGVPSRVPITESESLTPASPYGQTKLVIENMLRDLQAARPQWRIVLLRYFNPVGAHSSGRIGEDPRGAPDNLLPYVCQVAVGRRDGLRIFGDDYPTADGTGVRDYIHVVDLARGHLCALTRLESGGGVFTYNLGTGKGYSVLEMVSAFQRVTGQAVPYDIVARRPGDVASCYADPSKALAEMGWQASRGLEEFCADAWRWQRQNPDGFGPSESQ